MSTFNQNWYYYFFGESLPLFPVSIVVNKMFTTAYWLKEERQLSSSVRITAL